MSKFARYFFRFYAYLSTVCALIMVWRVPLRELPLPQHLRFLPDYIAFTQTHELYLMLSFFVLSAVLALELAHFEERDQASKK